jgi:hypothetical protein
VQKLLGALRAAVWLLVVWGALLLAAYLTDVLPELPWQRAPEPSPVAEEAEPEPDASPDAGVAVVPAPVAEVRHAADAGVAAATPEATEPLTTAGVQRYEACPPDALAPTLTALDVLGEGTELVLGCGEETHLLSVVPGPSGLAPVRVARFAWEAGHTRGERHGVAVTAADVNGDGRPDLLLGHLATATRSAAQQGALYYVQRDVRGGFEAAVALAPIAVASIAAAALDESAGLDVVALHQADTYGRRPSEAWVFTGGGAPARIARLDAGATARVVRALDLDRNGHLDVVTLGDGDPGGRVYFGDGNSRFPRNQPLVIAGAREAEVGDLDGDGAPDLVVGGDSLRLVRARANAAELAAEPIEAPAGLSNLTLVDMNDDGRLDLVGLLGDGIGLLVQTEGALAFEARPLADLPLAAGTVRAVAVAQLGGGEALDLAVLIKQPGEEHGTELVLLEDVASAIVPSTSAEASPIADAPLTLHIELR